MSIASYQCGNSHCWRKMIYDILKFHKKKNRFGKKLIYDDIHFFVSWCMCHVELSEPSGSSYWWLAGNCCRVLHAVIEGTPHWSRRSSHLRQDSGFPQSLAKREVTTKPRCELTQAFNNTLDYFTTRLDYASVVCLTESDSPGCQLPNQNTAYICEHECQGYRYMRQRGSQVHMEYSGSRDFVSQPGLGKFEVNRIVLLGGGYYTKPIYSSWFSQYFKFIKTLLTCSQNYIHIWQLSPQPSCGDNCQIWMWFNKSNWYFSTGKKYPLRGAGNDEQNFSDPHLKMDDTLYRGPASMGHWHYQG